MNGFQLLGWSPSQWRIVREWALDSGRREIPGDPEAFFLRYFELQPSGLAQVKTEDVAPYARLQSQWRQGHAQYDPELVKDEG